MPTPADANASWRTEKVPRGDANASSKQALNDRIDEAYRAKYGQSRYLAPMVSERARAATVRVAPAETD